MSVIQPIDNIRSGSEAGRTYARNKGGYYCRLRTTPTNPNTERQQATRTILGTQSAAWKDLTPAQQDAWDVYGQTHSIKNALGIDIFIAGQNWFCRINSRLVDAAQAPLTSPPVYGAPPGLSTFAITYQTDLIISIAFTPTTLPSYELLQVLFTKSNSMGSRPNINQTVMVAYSALAPSTPLTMTLPSPVPSLMQSTFYAARMNMNGHLSAFLRDTAPRGA